MEDSYNPKHLDECLKIENEIRIWNELIDLLEENDPDAFAKIYSESNTIIERAFKKLDKIYEEMQTYTCDFCRCKLEWDERDDTYGEIWGCDECGKTFCSKCLTEAVGETNYLKIMQSEGKILCPDCAKKLFI